MAQDTFTKCGTYLYAIVSSLEAPLRHPNGLEDTPGINGGSVTWICEGPVAAAVSEVPDRKIRPERRNLAAHQGVLKRLMQEGAVLPVTFGIIADDPDSTRRVLTAHCEELTAQIARVAGKVEMGLAFSWNAPNIFEYFVNTHSGLVQMRDEMFRGGRTPSREELIDLGRLFDRVLAGERALHTATVLQTLAPLCFEIRENPPRNEREIGNIACLVGAHAQAEFEQGIMAAAKLFDNHYSFDYNGPWPPYNFVDVNLHI
jgi:hypothetical protein